MIFFPLFNRETKVCVVLQLTFFLKWKSSFFCPVIAKNMLRVCLAFAYLIFAFCFLLFVIQINIKVTKTNIFLNEYYTNKLSQINCFHTQSYYWATILGKMKSLIVRMEMCLSGSIFKLGLRSIVWVWRGGWESELAVVQP